MVKFTELVRVVAVGKDRIVVERGPQEFEVDERDVLTVEIDFERGAMRVVEPG